MTIREKTIFISECNFMAAIAAQLYEQAPNRQPRKADIIMQKVKNIFRNDAMCYNDNEFYSIRIPESNVYTFIETLLFSITEFRELNLSQIEYESGISVDDEKRSRYHFTSRYDKYDSESWKSDFIDLNAFVRNVQIRLFNIIINYEDCFGCIYQQDNAESTLACGKSDKCKECIINPNLKNNYECRREPRGAYTIACAYDCYKSRYICCEECDEKDFCSHKCEGCSDNCGNKLNEDNVKKIK